MITVSSAATRLTTVEVDYGKHMLQEYLTGMQINEEAEL